jgi:hypothetical protein
VIRLRHSSVLTVLTVLSSADGYLKDDLVEWLEGRLNSNETTYAKHADFRDYYGRGGSPMKRERFSPVETVVSTKTRRQTLIEAPSYVFVTYTTRIRPLTPPQRTANSSKDCRYPGSAHPASRVPPRFRGH